MHPLFQDKTRATSATRKRRNKNKEVGPDPDALVGIGADAGKAQRGSIKTLQLKSGGTLSLAISVDVFSMNSEDREFVFGLIDKLQLYEKASTP